MAIQFVQRHNEDPNEKWRRLGEGIERGAKSLSEGINRGAEYKYSDRLRGDQSKKEMAFQDVKDRAAYERVIAKQQLAGEQKSSQISEKASYLNKILGLGNKSNIGDNVVSDDDFSSQQPLMNNVISQGGFDISKISPQQILAIGQVDPVAAKSIIDLQNIENAEKNASETRKDKKFESDRKFNSERSDPLVKEAQDVLKKSEVNRGLIAQQRRDIASGDTSGIIPFLVEKTGADIYKTPQSARFKTASKQRFVETVNEIAGGGARLNQFIEAQLVSAMPTLGSSVEAGLSQLDLEDFVEDVKVKRAELISDLAQQDMDKYGFVKEDISRRAQKEMKGYVEKRQDELAYDIQQRNEKNLTDDQLVKQIVSGKVAADTPLTPRVASILMIKNNDDEQKATQEAKKLGYRIPLESTYKRG